MQKQTRYLDLASPSGFIDFFGNEANKNFLIDFLNQVLMGAKVIRDLEYAKIKPRCREEGMMGAAISLICDIGEEKEYLVDLQAPDKDAYPDWSVHSLFRFTYDHSNKLREEDAENWDDYGVRDTNMIALLSFIDEKAPEDEYISYAQYQDKDTGDVFTDILTFTIIQLLKFNKTEDELSTDLDRWLYLVRKIGRMKDIPASLNKGIFREVFEAATVVP